jgi:hypothetical protein
MKSLQDFRMQKNGGCWSLHPPSFGGTELWRDWAFGSRKRSADFHAFGVSPEIVFLEVRKCIVLYAFLMDWKLLVVWKMGSYSQL